MAFAFHMEALRKQRVLDKRCEAIGRTALHQVTTAFLLNFTFQFLENCGIRVTFLRNRRQNLSSARSCEAEEE